MVSSRFTRFAAAAFSALLLSLLLSYSAQAQDTCTFEGPGTSWHVAGNWDCNVVPGAGDHVSTAGYPVRITSPVSVATVDLTSALEVNAILNVSESLTMHYGSTIEGSASAIVGASATLYLGDYSSVTVRQAELRVLGTIEAGTTEGAYTTLNLQEGASLVTEGTLSTLSGINIYDDGMEPRELVINTGTWSFSGASSSTISAPFQNDGTFSVSAGTHYLNGGGSHSGAFATYLGSTLQLGGLHELESGASFTGDQALTVNGTLYVPEGVSGLALQRLEVNGTLDARAPVLLTEALLLGYNSVISGTAEVAVDASGTLQLFDYSTTMVRNTQLRVLGTIEVGTTDGAYTTLNLYEGASLLTEGVVNVHAGFNIYDDSTGPKDFVINTGTWNFTGASNTSPIYVPFDNDGLVAVQAGTVYLYGGGSHTGEFGTSPGSTLDLSGLHMLESGASFTGEQALKVSGTLYVPEDVTSLALQRLELGGTLDARSPVMLTEALLLGYNSVISGTAEVSVDTTGTLQLFDYTSTMVRKTQLRVLGTIEAGATDGAYTALYLYEGALLMTDGVVNVNAGFNIYDDGTGVSESVHNTGSWHFVGASSTSPIYVPFENQGLLSVEAGTANLHGGGIHSGEFATSSGSSLDLNGLHLLSSGASFTGEQALKVSGTLYVPEGVTGLALQRLEVNGILDARSPVALTDALVLGYGSTISGTAEVLVDATGTLSLVDYSTATIRKAQLRVLGAIVAGTIEGVNTALYLQEGASLVTEGTVSTLSSLNIYDDGLDPMEFVTNTGTWTFTGSSNSNGINVPFNNNGVLAVEAGVVYLSKGGTHAGEFATSPGATLDLSALHVLASGASFTGEQALKVGGTLYIPEGVSALSLQRLELNGTLDARSPLTLTDALVLGNYSVISGTADVSVDTTGTLSLAQYASPTIRAVALHVLGTFEAVAHESWYSTLYLTEGASLHTSGTVEVRGSFTISPDSDGAVEFVVNTGLWTTEPGAVANINARFDNQGAIEVAQGELRLVGGGVHNGVFTVDSPGLLGFDGYHVLQTGVTFAGDRPLAASGTLLVPASATEITLPRLNLGDYATFDVRSPLTIGVAFEMGYASTLTGTTGTVLALGPASQNLIRQNSYAALHNIELYNLGEFDFEGSTSLNGYDQAVLRNGGVLRMADGANFTDNTASGVTFANEGTYQSTGSNAGLNVRVLNSGNIDVDGGSLSVGKLTQSAGSTWLNNANLSASEGVVLNGGVLRGNGSISGSVTNNGGTIQPGSSVGALVIDGNFTQGSAGSLEVELAGAEPEEFDLLDVNGEVTLDGTLNVLLDNGFLPVYLDRFPVVIYNDHSGQFATVNLPGDGAALTPLYHPNEFALETAPPNQAPQNHVPAEITVTKDGEFTFVDAFAITISDVDAASDAVQVALEVTGGELSLGSVAGITFAQGDGSDDETMTFTGTVDAINGALSGMTYQHTTGDRGTQTLYIVTDDLGNNGAGGALSDSDNIQINVIGVVAPVSLQDSGALLLAHAMIADPATLVSARYVITPQVGTPNGVVGTLSFFPTNGSTAGILTTGNATYADLPNDNGSTGSGLGGAEPSKGSSARDVTVLELTLQPPVGANCVRLDFAFYSEEYPEYVGSAYNDAFIAELGATTWQAESNILAPDNFAFDPLGDVVSINATGASAMSAINAAGTTYDGATTVLQAAKQVNSGVQKLYLSIFDQGDSALDSAVIVDNVRFEAVANPGDDCAPGVEQGVAAISLVKTVGITPACATTSELKLPSGGDDVTYCYTVTNTGNVTLTTHSLVDNKLGTLLTSQPISLTPGSSVSYTTTSTVAADTVNVATWSASGIQGQVPVTATAQATATVRMNLDPIANDDTFSAVEAVEEELDVLANDSTGADAGETLTIASVGTTSDGGTVTNNGDSLTYKSAIGFSGTEVFTYTITDGWGGMATAQVSVEVELAPVVQHTLTVNVVGNGSVSGTGITCGADCTEAYDAGTQVTLAATPASGHQFSGWSGACTGTGSCVVTMDAAKSVTATFAVIPPVQHTLTVNVVGNGSVSGTGITCGADCTEAYDAGTQVTLAATPASGHQFSGWSGACTGTGSCVVTMDAAKSVTATFAVIPPVQHTLTVNVVGNGSVSGTGITCGADCTEAYDAGTQVTLAATPASGHQFSGWSGACTGTGSCVVTMDAAKSVTATFAVIPPVQHTLTVNVVGNGSVSGTGITCGADCTEAYDAGTQVTLAAAPASGHQFSGWSGACSGTGSCVVSMDAAKSVTATFAVIPPVQHTLTVAVVGNGSVSGTGIACGADCTEAYDAGTQVTLAATPASGHQFSGWSGACTGTGSCVVTMDAAKSVTATFALIPPVQHTLTVVVVGNGSVSGTGITCGADCTEAYDAGTQVTLAATPASGHQFSGWSGACTGTGSCVVTMDAAKSVTATFAVIPPVQHTLTVNVVGNGSVSGTGITCGADCTEAYDAGTQVTLAATPASGHQFSGWSGACTGTGSCVVTMDAAKSVTATFAVIPPVQHTLTVNVVGNGSVSGTGITCGADCTEAYDAGTQVTLAAAPASGHQFSGWSGACAGTSSCVVTMDSAKSVSATFAVIPPVQHTLTVAVVGNGSVSGTGITCGADCTEAYDAGTQVTLAAAPASGHQFSGWSGACTGTGSCVVSMDAAKSVTATFAVIPPVQHTLTVAVVGNGSVSGTGIACGADCTEAYDAGTQVTLAATPASGHQFSGWSGACTGTGSCVVTMDAAKSVTATFAVIPPVQHTLTVNVVGNGSVSGTGITCGADCTEAYDAGTQVTLAATPASGHQFSGWSGACTGTGGCVVTMDAAKSVTATFAVIPPVQHTLTVNVVGNGSVSGTGITCGADCTEAYDAGTQVTLAATPASGHQFSGWSGACTGTGSCVVTMDAAKSVTATFAVIPPVQHTLTVVVVGNGSVSGTGITCGADCTEAYDAGTQVTLAATPASGHQFSGWSGACTGTGSCVVTMDAAKSVTATFAVIPPVDLPLTITSVSPSWGFAGFQQAFIVKGAGYTAGTMGQLSANTVIVPLQVTLVTSTTLIAVAPPSTGAGTYHLALTDGARNASLANAYKVHSATAEELYSAPEFLVTNPQQLHTGDSATIKLRVYRNGAAGSPPLTNLPVQIRLNDANGPLLGTVQVPSLKRNGDAWTTTLPWTVPAAGDYTLVAVIDPANSVNEADETNNVISRVVTVKAPKPDLVAPVINQLRVTPKTTRNATIRVRTSATDPAPGTDVKQMYIADYVYSASAKQFVARGNTGWIPFSADMQFKLWEQTPVHFVVVWVADGAGNVSTPKIEAVTLLSRKALQQGGHDFFFWFLNGVNAAESEEIDVSDIKGISGDAESITVTLTPISGDPDLYVWTTDGSVHSINESGVDQVTVPVPADGKLMIEVHGYADSEYDLSIEESAVISSAQAPDSISAKTPLTEPVVPLDIAMPDEVAPESMPESVDQTFGVLLPMIQR